MSHATPLAVQNMPDVFPDDPNWQSGSVGSLQSVPLAHMDVQAANSKAGFEQLKQVVPDEQGCPARRPAPAATVSRSAAGPAPGDEPQQKHNGHEHPRQDSPSCFDDSSHASANPVVTRSVAASPRKDRDRKLLR